MSRNSIYRNRSVSARSQTDFRPSKPGLRPPPAMVQRAGFVATPPLDWTTQIVSTYQGVPSKLLASVQEMVPKSRVHVGWSVSL